MTAVSYLRRNRTGFFYAYIHFAFEVSSFFILTTYIQDDSAYLLALLYDFYAFVPQGIVGYVLDEGIRLPLLGIGTVFTAAALILTAISAPGTPTVLVISIGSILIHVSGAERTLRESSGKMTMSAVFVSGGSFGLIIGKILAMYGCPVWIVLLIALTMLIPGAVLRKDEKMRPDAGQQMIRKQLTAVNKQTNQSQLTAGRQQPTQSACSYHFANPNLPAAVVIILAVFVVAVRAYMGYGIPTSWKKTLLQTVMLYFFMGTGKALGGILIDRIGIRKTILLSTLGAAPFLIAGDRIMVISLIGVMLFSMTMAVTLAIIVSRMPKYPGIAFGMTTIGLFLGTWAIFFSRLPKGIAGTLITIGVTVLCCFILLLITPPGKPANKNPGTN